MHKALIRRLLMHFVYMQGDDDGYLESARLVDVTFFNTNLDFADMLLKN